MSKPPLHILHTEPGQDRLLPDLHPFAQARNLGVDRFDLLIFFSQLSADVLTGLPIPHVSLVQRLNSLENGLPLLARFVGLASFFFDLVFQLFQSLSLPVDFLINRIGPCRRHQAYGDEQAEGCWRRPYPPHTLASSNRRRDKKLPAQPRMIPTATSKRQIERGKNTVSCSSPRKRPVVRICCLNSSYKAFSMSSEQVLPNAPRTAPSSK